MATAQRDEDFLMRINKHRVDGVQKQDDDYYGEKIQTVCKQCRQCCAFLTLPRAWLL